jgi:hypothetical protein
MSANQLFLLKRLQDIKTSQHRTKAKQTKNTQKQSKNTQKQQNSHVTIRRNNLIA